MSVHEVFPYLRVHPAADAIRWYREVFGATERFRLVDPSDGRVGHCELDLGGAVLMVSDPYPEAGIHAPDGAGTASSLHLHVDDADALLARAVAAGATLLRPAQDHFHGERSGAVRDPFGHEWLIGHQLEDVPPEEMQRRWDALVR